ncbi:hypothetical protein ACM43_01120 [Bradyrhizobium sp. CCBAU 45321]|nr:hypothetical protein [Bradyrhizobium sp. CCBAU 45321]
MSSILFRFCSSDIKAVEQIEPISQAELQSPKIPRLWQLFVQCSVTAPPLGTLQPSERFDRLCSAIEGLHHDLAIRADPAKLRISDISPNKVGCVESA